jgi:hypothetical protein
MIGEGAAMRTFLTAAALALVSAAPAGAATRNFGISSFERIRVDGPFKVVVSTGVAPFATATGSSAAIDGVSLKVEGKTLVVRADRSRWGGYPGEQPGSVRINIGTHDLTTAWLNGAGSLEIDRVRGLQFDLSMQGAGSAAIARADVDVLKIGLAGTSSAVIGGQAKNLTAIVRGISSLDASGLRTNDVKVGAEGPATVKAHVTGTAKIEARGTATIQMTGEPSCISTLEGSSTVSGCR